METRTNAYAEYLNTIDAEVYSTNQAYIAMAYISLQVADLGISSVIMQGFNAKKLNAILAEKGYIDSETEAVHISIAIGYPTKQAQKMFIHNFELH